MASLNDITKFHDEEYINFMRDETTGKNKKFDQLEEPLCKFFEKLYYHLLNDDLVVLIN